MFIGTSHRNHIFSVIRLTPAHPSDTSLNVIPLGSFPDLLHVRFPAGTDGSLQPGN